MFIPKRIVFEKDVLKYDMANNILERFKDKPKIEIIHMTSNRIKDQIPGNDLPSWYEESKKTLVVGIKKSAKFQTCKPSAHYQLPLVSGCMGHCEYCYLNTMLGDRPFVKVYANTEEILNQAGTYIEERLPDITIFEGAATSDPLPLEPYTHTLENAIEFFGKNNNARFRFVTKYNDIDSLVNINHGGKTEIRFSLNTAAIIDKYEHFTAKYERRIEASIKAINAGYPVGYLIAPVFIYDNWKEDYRNLLLDLKEKLPAKMVKPVTFEIISHRYTLIAKNRIQQVFPDSDLPMNEEERSFKYGQFGYGKYVYPKETMQEIKQFFMNVIEELFTEKEVKYII